MNLQLAKGTRDLPPERKLAKERIIAVLRRKFEAYGFSPLETPIIERYETLVAKFAAGEGTDVSNEIFKF
ncbi:MAG TPA: histidine--tRNA ligase, partial [Candidatus Nanoarchaeia archaeon]|nr:histidine--tRNA ligase [Candidatus Nanoarchaeia archaeon]